MNPPQSPGTKPKIGLVLIGGASEGGGGTGRRFARLFQHLQANQARSEVWLITKPEFLELMDRSSIPIDASTNVLFFEDGPAKPGTSVAGKIADYRDASSRLSKLVLEHDFDLVHFPIPNLAYAPYLLRTPDGVRQVFSMTAAVGSFESMNWKAQLLYRIGFECADAIDTLYSDIADRFPSYAEKLHVSPCSFTDYGRYQPADEKENWIVFAGRLEAFKNPELFVEATHLAADALRENGWKCLLFGDGELRESVEERIARYDIADLIEIDQVPDLSATLNRSRVFVSIQQTENYPSQVLLEAMAAGNAVIATDVGETRKIVDEEVGLLIASQTPAALAEALRDLSGNDELREQLARNARGRILDQHTLDRFAGYMEAFWLDALDSASAPPRPSWPALAGMLLAGAVGMKFR